MNPESDNGHSRFSRADGLLLVAAVVGLALYIFLMPAQHPDTAGDYRLGRESAMEAAGALLAENGYDAEDLDVQVELRRNAGLLRSLQDSLGRPATVALLKTDAGEPLTAYRWVVNYRKPVRRESENGISFGQQNVMTVVLTLDGRIAGFSREDRTSHLHVNRAVLAKGLMPGQSVGHETAPEDDLFREISDTSLVKNLHFNFDGLLNAEADSLNVLPLLRAGQSVPLNAARAVAMARAHLRATPLTEVNLRVDSVWVLPERVDRVAQVRFVSVTPFHEQDLHADVEIAATGSLQKMDVGYNAPVADSEDTLRFVVSGTKVGLYGLLILFLLVAFFRRTMARLIDVKAALIDAVTLGIFAAVFIGLSKDFIFDNEGISLWIRLLLGAFIVSLVAGLTMLFAFMMSSATDSVARSVWVEKIFTLSLVRQGDVLNQPVGIALVRGSALAMILLGTTTILLWVFPEAGIAFAGPTLPDKALQPFVWISVFEVLCGYLVATLVLLGVGSFCYRTKHRVVLAVGGITLALALLQTAPVTIEPGVYAWLVSGVTGLVIAVAFWRYDVVTCWVAFTLARLLSTLAQGWLMPGSPVVLDLVLAGLLVTGLLALGIVGVVSGRTGREVEEYIPAYIVEMTGQERLKRELEIAHQVQLFFLPQRMPSVPGLDVAGMCLPAQEVGGDYYDFVEIDDRRLAVVVGDVSGKGIEAAFYMTLTKGFLRTLCREIASPAEVLRRLNALFYENAQRGVFVSMIYGVVDVGEATFTFARAGHNPVILKRSPSQEAALLQPAGLGIGLVVGPRFDETIEEEQVGLRPGDALVFYTDGFSEAMNGARDLYSDERLVDEVGRVGARPATEILQSVTDDVHRFVEDAERHDDMTMVVIKVNGQSEPALAESEPAEAEA